MKSDNLVIELLKYLNDDTYNYAVMIDGGWGSGKSYFIKNKLMPALGSDDPNSAQYRPVCYISLYGVTNASDFRERLRNELFARCSVSLLPSDQSSKLYSALNSKHGHIVRQLINDVMPAVIGDKMTSAGKNILNDVTGLLNVKDFIFIFDDLERCACPVNILFGEMNSLVELDGAKVILVANLEEIRRQIQAAGPMAKGFASEGNALSRYRALSEKLVGITYRYTPELEETMRAIINDTVREDDGVLKPMLLENVPVFAGTCRSSGHLNLRTFQFFISRVRNFYDQFKTLRFGVEEDSRKVLEHTLHLLFVYAIYAKGGELNKEKAPEPMRNLEDSYSLNAYIFDGDFNLQHYIDEMERFCSEDE